MRGWIWKFSAGVALATFFVAATPAAGSAQSKTTQTVHKKTRKKTASPTAKKQTAVKKKVTTATKPGQLTKVGDKQAAKPAIKTKRKSTKPR